MNTKQELYQLIQQKDKERQKNIEKRAIKTIIVFSIVFMILFYLFDQIYDVKSLLCCIGASVVCSVIYFFVNAIIFSQLSNVSRKEQDVIDRLQKRYDELND